MARRRHQNPKPFKEGNFWWINPWQDEFREGKLVRKRKRIRLCGADEPHGIAFDRAQEELSKQNAQTIGSATLFRHYVDGIYRTTELPLLDKNTRVSYETTWNKHLLPIFGEIPLRDMTALRLQGFFSALGGSELSPPTVLKIKEVLSTVLSSAVRYEMLNKNPMGAVRIPRNKRVNRRKPKPYVTPEEFTRLVEAVSEPYSTMIYVAVYSGLRVSELAGLKWEDVHKDALTVDERCSRGNWSVTKTAGSSATIAVDASVIQRINRLKALEVVVNWGGQGAHKCIKVVRSDRPQDLVFQSVRKGTPMSDGNILRRHLRPAALKLGMDPKKANWQALRRSCATWYAQAGVNPKSIQGQMRHSRIATTMDVYTQHVPEDQRRAVAQMMEWETARRATIN